MQPLPADTDSKLSKKSAIRLLARYYLRRVEAEEHELDPMIEDWLCCHALGQFSQLADGAGFVAWVRFQPNHLPEPPLPRIAELVERFGAEELRTGSTLYILDLLALKPGAAYDVCRKLSRLPGVRDLAGLRLGRLRRRRMRNG